MTNLEQSQATMMRKDKVLDIKRKSPNIKDF